MIYLFLDADDYLAHRRLSELKQALGDPELADLNVTELDGKHVDVSEVLYNASVMPFLSDRRLVIVRDFLNQLDKRLATIKSTDHPVYGEIIRLMDGLPQLPDTCDLVFIDRSVDKRRHLWKGFSRDTDKKRRKIPGIAELIKAGTIQLEALETPNARALPGWIQNYARSQEIRIDGRAVQMLADYVGTNLRQLTNELEKLAAYAAGRTITASDVQLLVSDASEALIWDLTDALSQRNGRKAMRSLYELRRNDANPFYLLSMIARQYRIMIKVKDAMSGASVNEYDIAKLVGEKPYPVKKAMQQCRQYQIDELESIMERLLNTDYAMKTGSEPNTEIDVLVAELTQRHKV
jgi:DNA polymerase-3 subunit delta